MKQISKSQSKKNNELARIKKEKLEKADNRCVICGYYEKELDLIHILPRSLFPEHITKEWNLECACRSCHDSFDSSAFSRRESGLYEKVAVHDPIGSSRYFQMNNK